MFPKYSLLALASIFTVTIAINIPTEVKIQEFDQKYSESNDLTAGARLEGDRLLLQEYVSKSSAILQIVTVQKNFQLDKYEKITQVVCSDQAEDGTGAYPTILEGGPGYNHVTIKFKSQRGEGIKFQVQIYAKL